jgi:hypothetical protein
LALFSSDNEEVNDAINRINNEEPEPAETTATPPNEDEEDDTEEDIIMQKLRRSHQSGPINPMREHDKMLKENQDEFHNVTSDTSDGNEDEEESLYKSTFYNKLIASYVDPDLDVYGSHDEEYVDEQMVEMLTRNGDDLEKLGPGLSTTPLDPASDEAKVEQNLAQKESMLQKVVDQIDAGEGKYDKEKIQEAAKLKADIDRMHIDDFGNVLIANLAFYEAFSARDADGMKEVWWQSPSTVCVHPSHQPLVGSRAVLDNFKNMFDQEAMNQENCRNGRAVETQTAPSVFLSPSNIRALSVRGTTASLVCDEDVIDRANSLRGRFVINKLLSTNVFRKIGGKWKMVHRHASWHPETLAAQAAMKAKTGFAPAKTEREEFNESLREKRMKIHRLGGPGTSVRPTNAQSATPETLDGLNANNVVGVADVKIPKKKKSNSEKDDLLSLLGISKGSSDDDDDDEDDEDDSSGSKRKSNKISLSDLLSAGGEGETTTTGSGTPEDPFITRRVIRIGPEGFEKLAAEGDKLNDDDEDDDDDEEEGTVIDLRGMPEEERRKVLSSVFPNQVEAIMKQMEETSKKGEENIKSLKSALPEIVPAPIIQPKQSKQSATQKCIDAIRKLSDEGQLSSKQKRVLLTDIIASSARGETSMVEVAYGLLLSDDSEPGMEDFTEQCRVFASASLNGNEY